MRVITGQFKGRRLRAPADLSLRPTSDQVKESLFNIVGARVLDSIWLDLFAGAGAIGIEALSRGAQHVVFVENQPRAWKLIEYNIEHCRIRAGFTLMKSDARRALRRCREEGRVFDIIFLDPPYQSNLYEETLQALSDPALLAPEGLVIAEHHRKIELRDQYGGLRRDQVRHYGTTCLSFFSWAKTDPPSEFYHRRDAEDAEKHR